LSKLEQHVINPRCQDNANSHFKKKGNPYWGFWRVKWKKGVNPMLLFGSPTEEAQEFDYCPPWHGLNLCKLDKAHTIPTLPTLLRCGGWLWSVNRCCVGIWFCY
jgi:hypothetical protein